MTDPTPAELKFKTREDWLQAAIKELRPTFDRHISTDPALTTVYGIPDDVRVSVGFGYKARAETKYIAGQTWSRITTEDKSPAVFISPMLGDAVEVLVTLTHELIHVALDCEDGHTKRFKVLAEALGLEAPLTQINPSDLLILELTGLLEFLGPYPHAAIDVDVKVEVPAPVGPDGQPAPTGDPEFKRLYVGPKPQVSRWIKCMCMHEGCILAGRFHGRFSRTVIELAHPICPACHNPLSVQS
jgi:hypothetical protein